MKVLIQSVVNHAAIEDDIRHAFLFEVFEASFDLVAGFFHELGNHREVGAIHGN